MRKIFQIKMNKPNRKNKKKLTHSEAVNIINHCEQSISSHLEYFKFYVIPQQSLELVSNNGNEKVFNILNPDKTIKDLITRFAILEATIEYASKYITTPVKTLNSYFYPYKEPSNAYQAFISKVFNQNRLKYLPIEFI